MRFICPMSSLFFSYLLHMTFLIIYFHVYSLCHVYITSLSSIHNTRTSTSYANTFLYVSIFIFLSYILSRITSYTLSMFRLFQKRLNLCSDTTKLSRPPDPGPTRLASPNRSLGRDTIYTIYCILYCIGTLIDMFFLRVVLVPVVYKQFL